MKNIKLSCSGSHKWTKCSYAPIMENETYCINTNYKTSSEGVLIHKLIEHKIKKMQGDLKYINNNIEEEITPEIEKIVNTYIECLLEASNNDIHSIYIEEKINLEHIYPKMLGIADAIVINIDNIQKKVYANIFDLKTGFTKISAKNNPQLYLYLLGLYDKLKTIITYGYTIISRVHIIQPSINYTSSVELTSEQIEDFRKFINDKIYEINNNPKFNPGEHCSKYYCKARHSCRAYAEYVNKDINKIIELKKSEKELTDEELIAIIEKAPEFSKWMEGVISNIKDKILNTNYKLPGYKLKTINKRSLIKDKSKIIMHLDSLGIDESCYMEYNLMSLSKIEKILGKRCKDLEPIVEESIFRTTLQKINNEEDNNEI